MPNEPHTTPLGERIVRVETQLANLSQRCVEHLTNQKDFQKAFGDGQKDLNKKLDDLAMAVSALQTSFKAHISHTLSGRDKAVIAVAVIEGLFALAIAVWASLK